MNISWYLDRISTNFSLDSLDNRYNGLDFEPTFGGNDGRQHSDLKRWTHRKCSLTWCDVWKSQSEDGKEGKINNIYEPVDMQHSVSHWNAVQCNE